MMVRETSVNVKRFSLLFSWEFLTLW